MLLIREGWQVGKKLVYRLYREEGLGLRARPKARRTVSEHSRQKPRAGGANQVWSLDFVADQLSDGRRFRALTVVDVYSGNAWPLKSGRASRARTSCACCSRLANNEEYRGCCSVISLTPLLFYFPDFRRSARPARPKPMPMLGLQNQSLHDSSCSG